MELSHLDFEQTTIQTNQKPRTADVGNIPLPDEMPRRQDLSQIPREILKSSTVENLISQNEDLMARLKVALRRLSVLENENQRFNEEAHRARLSQSASADQLMVMKEKDNLWKSKIDALEREKDIATEKMQLMKTQLVKASTELERHQKYHERIKNQVKPYIAQLKDYSKAQETKSNALARELEQKETQLHDIRHQIIEVTKNSRMQIEQETQKAQELTSYYETQFEKIQNENNQLKERQAQYDIQSLQLTKALERHDELENEIIEVGRSKEDLKARLEKEILRLQERSNELTRHNQKLGIEHADLQVRVLDDQEKISRLDQENSQMREQLDSLRYMWTAKNEECEKLKSAMSSLEKLNLELSRKINEQRSPTAEA